MKFKVGDKVIVKDDPLERGWIETVERVCQDYVELISTDKHPHLTNAVKFELYEPEKS